MAVRVTLSLYSRRIICSYRSPLISQLRYLRDRLKPINVNNCRLVPLGQRFPERFPSFVRWNSSSAASSGAQNPDIHSSVEQYIPEPPSPLVDSDTGSQIVEQLTALGEPTLQSLGLASWYPSGLIQKGLEALHVGLDIPWWTSIVLGTVIIRMAMFPLFIYVQKQMVMMNNHMPKVQKMQEQAARARRAGDLLEAARIAMRMHAYMKETKVNPMKNAIGPMSQLPVFLSVFIGIRQMTNLPVESLKTGGTAWFTDLTVSDPYFALPVITMSLLYATIELGVDGVRAGNMPKTGRIVMRVMPCFILPFIMSFPTGLLCYWCTSNGFSLIQAAFLRIPRVRQALDIPAMVVQKVDPASKKSVVQTFKEGWKTAQLMDAEALQRADATRFKEAGLGAVPKTYPYDPTKLKKVAAAKASKGA